MTDDKPGTSNAASDVVADLLIQARDIHGGIHFHAPADSSVVEVDNLPYDVNFAARQDELRQLNELLLGEARRPRVVVISGIPGVGKTATAVHWAHRNAVHFPDGLIYLDLRGFTSGAEPMDAEAAAQSLLAVLGVRTATHGLAEGESSSRFRQTMRGRRALVLLDNAIDSGQVLPLVPSGLELAVVITSRATLDGLVGRGASFLRLDVLTPEGGKALMVDRLGQSRDDIDLEAVESIVDLCGRLPLALSVVAARLEIETALSPSAVCDELSHLDNRMAFLNSGEPNSALSNVFSWSAKRFSPQARLAFLAFAVARSNVLTTDAVVAASGLTQRSTQTALDELRRASLVQLSGSRQYRMHDLLLDYSSEMLSDSVTREELDHRVGFYLRHLAAAAYSAERAIYPLRDEIPSHLAPSSRLGNPPSDYDTALRWFQSSQPLVVTGVELAQEYGHYVAGWQISWSATTYLDRSGRWRDYLASQESGLRCARAMGDPHAEALSLRLLATAQSRLGDAKSSEDSLTGAMALLTGDPMGRARTTLALAFLAETRGEFHRALEHATDALDLYSELGNLAGIARSLSFVSWYRVHVDVQDARSMGEVDSAILRLGQLRHTWELAHAYFHKGYIAEKRGEPAVASTCYSDSRRLFAQLRDDFYEARSLLALGDVLAAYGSGAAELDEARQAWTRCYELLRPFGSRYSEQPHHRLLGLNSWAEGVILGSDAAVGNDSQLSRLGVECVRRARSVRLLSRGVLGRGWV